MNKEEIPIEYYLTKNGEVIKFVRYEELDKYKQVLDKIKEKLEKYNDKETNMYAPIQELLELLEEIDV